MTPTAPKVKCGTTVPDGCSVVSWDVEGVEQGKWIVVYKYIENECDVNATEEISKRDKMIEALVGVIVKSSAPTDAEKPSPKSDKFTSRPTVDQIKRMTRDYGMVVWYDCSRDGWRIGGTPPSQEPLETFEAAWDKACQIANKVVEARQQAAETYFSGVRRQP